MKICSHPYRPSLSPPHCALHSLNRMCSYKCECNAYVHVHAIAKACAHLSAFPLSHRTQTPLNNKTRIENCAHNKKGAAAKVYAFESIDSQPIHGPYLILSIVAWSIPTTPRAARLGCFRVRRIFHSSRQNDFMIPFRICYMAMQRTHLKGYRPIWTPISSCVWVNEATWDIAHSPNI